ncbi:G-alpha-domain-containing protein [Daedalea quercina L-15889]|uniref:G-alpha-domain-containing protein n=1 Tax=Daedalea quercina L-15889 TaxID=1314783 RepID=A0A165LFN1_9APHY|nr:G-alpha-domain-containing protein [Daedalea quercina L-15889]
MVTLALDPLDPLTRALLPPKDESPADRWAREQREAQARLISEQIDAQLKAGRAALKKRPKPIKVLLLGQSESGKSTTVKNFQLAYAYSQFIEERSAWRAVIHLNLVRSVNTILDVLSRELSRSSSQPHSPRSTSPTRSPRPSIMRPSTSHAASASKGGSSLLSGTTISGDTLVLDIDPDADDDLDDDEPCWPSPTPLSDRHRLLQLRLAPLRQIQRDLERSLGAATTEAPEYSGAAAPWERYDSGGRRPREFAVTSRTGWKSALRRVKSGYNAARRVSLGSREETKAEQCAQGSLNSVQRSRRRLARPMSPFGVSSQDANDEDEGEDGLGGLEGQGEPQAQTAAEIISSCAEDMAALWADAGVQAVLARRKMKTRLEEGPGFFLDDVARVAAREYEPSDEDVVRARLRTMGVQEYRFRFDKVSPIGLEADREWILYDVGGARSSRHAWYPYFDDINALIFLAPISCFDERLAEDRRVNRLQDSLQIWKAVCSSMLLAKVQLILFLNKCDLLEKKIQRGVQVSQYVTSYGNRPNEAKAVAKYFRQQFKDIFIKHSPEKRTFYSYLTSVVDTKATAVTVAAVHDGIQRQYMRDADIL